MNTPPRLNTNYSAQSSPVNHRPNIASSSSSSLTASSQSSSSLVTVEGLLSAHCTAQNPHLAALEQVVADRNTLSAQNAQLWKLFEKQRAGYNHIHKEFERVRAEREFYKSRLQAINPGLAIDKKKERSLNDSSSRIALVRHQSDDPTTPRVTDHHLSSSRSQEPLLKSPSSIPPRSESLPSTATLPEPPPVPNPTDITPIRKPTLTTEPLHANLAPIPTSLTPALPPPQTLLTPSSPSDPSNVWQAHESRVSLPSETKRYIANISESPLPSPRFATSFPLAQRSLQDLPSTNSSQSHLPSVTPSDEQDRSEFLDMDDEGVSNISDIEIDEPPPPVSTDATIRKPRAAADDFPLPPSHGSAHVSSEDTRTAEEPTPLAVNGGPHIRVDTDLMSIHSSPSAHPVGQATTMTTVSTTVTTTTTTPQFRALPLLATDLPHTRIQVSHSSIRPNDRGKDVLSFIVVVDPGSSKETWKIEKLYSDVLGLDSRVRASVGKGVGKKIGSLPEGKLWRDHAPAKADQRKTALETYLQSLINLPIKDKTEVIAFFTSDILRETKQPVSQAGYKEGYLTKRGKNFGGWKTRYFVLQGPVLEYYESRGGAHLGSITVTGAQIGRQQRSGDRRESDEEKEYRHAFLIIEAKKGPGGGSIPRHVLCAESDHDRDSWVEVLVRYVMGSYSEDAMPAFGPSPITIQARSSTSSLTPSEQSVQQTRRPGRGASRDRGLVPSMEELRAPSPAKSSTEPSPIDRSISHSLPSSSPLEGGGGGLAPIGQRANSELGHYPDMQDRLQTPRNHSPERHRGPRNKTHQPTLATVDSSPTRERPVTPEQVHRTPETNGKVKISGPLNGAPIPAGYKFGGKDTSMEQAPTPSDRREKAKSRSFWGFGRPNAAEKSHPAASAPRAVFGVTLEDSLEVAQIANLPAIVFRCIQYLEAKKADQEEGIYRLSGSSAVIKSLKDRFNSEGDVDLIASDEYWDPHAIAGLLKSFLRELPASILTRDLHLRFLAVIDFVDPQERIKELSRLIAALPIANYSLLRALTAHLILIVQNSGVNKMTMRNVGIVFSPTLGIPAGVFSLMLGEFNRVFNVDADADLDAGGQGEETAVSDLSRRNSRQYSDAAADQLLGLSGRTLLSTPVEEGPSDEGDDFSVDDSIETTDYDATMSSSRSSPGPGTSPPNAQQTPTQSLEREREPQTPSGSRSKASHVAATRGLNIAVSERGNRHSRMLGVGAGIPSSPRPVLSPASVSSPSVSATPK